MATPVIFNGKTFIEPGAYAAIKSGTTDVIAVASSGNVCLIDTGSGAGWGGGSGIDGELEHDKKAVYGFTDLGSAQNFIRGGLLWDLIQYLFKPEQNSAGIPKLYLVRAATTVCATISYTFTGGGSAGGTFTLKCRNEGVAGNGTSSSSVLRTGYGALMSAGTAANTFKITFYEGTYRGTDPDGDSYSGIALAASPAQIIAVSPDFTNISTLITWLQTNYNINTRFYCSVGTVTGAGTVNSADLSANNTLVLATGGTTSYTSGNVDKVLAAITELDNTFFLCDKYNANAVGTENTKILAHINLDAEFDKFMFVGGGDDDTTFTQANGSILTAQYFDDASVITVHSGVKVPKKVGVGLKTLPVIYHTAAALGRIAGIEPQTPGTWKKLVFSNFLHDLKKSEREVALQAGVLHSRFVAGIGWVMNQAINTLQTNTQLINPDGSSYEISIMRIAAQLNKELSINARQRYVGGNANTASPAELKAFVEGFLLQRTATVNQDNLILSYKNVTVNLVQDYYDVKYAFVPNGPINKLFFTGFVLDINLTA